MLKTKTKQIIKEFLWKLLADANGLTSVKVLTGPAKGTKLLVDLRCEASYWLGSYDRKVLQHVVSMLKPGQVAYDCGAFLGYYAAAMRKAVGSTGRVFAFEGSGRNFQRLALLPIMNGWPNVEVYHLAIGEQHSRIKFVSNRGPASGPAMYKTQSSPISSEVEEVDCSGIDELVFERGFPPPHLLKLDLEGAERDALLNGARVWEEIRPVILVELHKDGSGMIPPSFEAAEKFLSQFRYEGTEVHLGVRVQLVEDFLLAENRGVQCTILATPRV